MNKLKSFKYKTNSENGIFTKISKRYSSVKFLRQTPGRKNVTGNAAQPQSTGSYDMSGQESEDLKREIGAPVLISKTTIDTDATDYCLQPINENVVTNQSAHLNDKTESVANVDASTVVLRKKRSKSATNLHKSEIKVFLHKAPSLEFDKAHQNTSSSSYNYSSSDNNSYDIPRKLHLKDCGDDNPQRNEVGQINMESSDKNGYSQIVESVKPNVDHEHFVYASRNSLGIDTIDSNGCRHSHESLGLDSSFDDDFDLKSASFQSLEARNLFLSIEELNEITRQINESEDFNQEIDLEYCEHRDKLRPEERRITLLRNKNSSKLNLVNKKEKLSNAWTGLKHWIDEEKVKLKDVMHKHAALQRVGAVGNNTESTPSTTGTIVKNQDFFDQIKKPSLVRRRSSPRKYSLGTEENTSRASASLTKRSASVKNRKVRAINDENLKPSSDVLDHSCDQDIAKKSVLSNKYSLNVKDLLPEANCDDQTSIVRKNSNCQSSSTASANTSTITTTNQNYVSSWEGQNGFEELRRYLKQGGDFGKDLVTILQERVDAEQLYAKSLSKMASKLNKACREIPGSLAEAWRGVATEMESRGEVHRIFSNSMVEEIVKPLKTILDNQHKTRKTIESTVDKSARILSEWRTAEAKAKKSSHAAARENEKLQDAMLDVRIQRSPSVAMLHHNNHKSPDKEIKSAEKDCAKLDNKRRKAEESVKRADVEYYTLCIRAERARVEWEMSVLRGSTILQNHENQRLTALKNYVTDYLKFSNEMNPSINEIMERLAPHVNACNVQKDLTVVKNIRRASEGPSEQLLPDFYCEHTTLAMNRERRKHALVKLLQLVRTDLERERKSRNGLKELSHTLNTQENQNITDKLYHIRSMLTYLEGARFKLQSALLELDHKPRGSHPLAPHIQITRDRTGLQQSILKVPLWLKNGDETDQLSKEFRASDIDDELDLANERCIDSRNETLIKHFDRNFNRSKSSLEFTNNSDSDRTRVGLQSNGETNTKRSTLSSSRSGSPVFDRGIADGGSNQPDSDFDEFSSQDEDDELGSKKQLAPRIIAPQSPAVISRCRALYSYSPKLYDELELNPGDLIDVHAKQEDGWWMGALKSKIGIFPATYVEEIA